MKRINYSLILTSVALIMLLFSCGESEREEATSTVNRNTESAATRAEKSDSKKELTGKVYEIVEDMPTFPGGVTELMNYLSKNTHYPAATKRDGIQGRVVVSFIVEPDGSISNVKLVRSVDANLDREALRVVSEMPNWTPGKQGGNKVRVRYSLPIAFRL